MQLAKKLVFLFLAILLSVLTSLLLLAHALHETMLRPYSWHEYISGEKVQVLIKEQLEKALQEQTERVEEALPPLLPRETFRTVIENVIEVTVDHIITAAWLEKNIEAYQHHIWDYLTGKSDEVKPVQMEEVIRSFAEELDGELIRHGFPKPIAGSIAEEFASRVNIEWDPLKAMQVEPEQLKRIRDGYERIQNGYRFLRTAFIGMAVIGLIVAFYPKTMLRWGGLTLSWLGVLSLLLLITFHLLVMIVQGIQGPVPGLRIESSGFHDLLLDSSVRLLEQMKASLAQLLLPLAPVAIGCGFLLFALGRLKIVEQISDRLEEKLAEVHVLRVGRALVAIVILAGLYIYGVSLGVIHG